MDGILSQDSAISALRGQLCGGRLHHAQLFHGPDGVGKLTTALALAKVVLCHQRPAPDQACGSCESCLKLRDLNRGEVDPTELPHPDLRLVVKEMALKSADAATRRRKMTSIPVAVLREFLLEPAQRSAMLGHGKVLVVDEAELLDLTGQNLLLKTLEEPPPGTFIILIARRADQMLATIRSRCQSIAFGALRAEVMDRLLNERLPDLDADTRGWLCEAAEGSVGRALQMAQWQVQSWRGTLLPMLDQVLGGHVRADMGDAWMAALDQVVGHIEETGENVSKLAATAVALRLMADVLSQHVRGRMHQQLEQGEAALAPWVHALSALEEAVRWQQANVTARQVCGGLSTALHQAAQKQLV